MMGWEEFREAVERCAGLGALIGAGVGALYWGVCWWLQRMWR